MARVMRKQERNGDARHLPKWVVVAAIAVAVVVLVAVAVVCWQMSVQRTYEGMLRDLQRQIGN